MIEQINCPNSGFTGLTFHVFLTGRATAKTLMSALRTMGREIAITHAQIRLDHSAAPVLRATTWELMV